MPSATIGDGSRGTLAPASEAPPQGRPARLARTPLAAFLCASGAIAIAALVIMKPQLPAIVTAVVGVGVSMYLARHIRLGSDVVAVAVLLALGLMLVAAAVFLVDLSATGGFH